MESIYETKTNKQTKSPSNPLQAEADNELKAKIKTKFPDIVLGSVFCNTLHKMCKMCKMCKKLCEK